jgi:hypothetical protein
LSAVPLTREQMQAVVDAFAQHGTKAEAAVGLGLISSTFANRLRRAVAAGFTAGSAVKPTAPVSEVVNVAAAVKAHLMKRAMSLGELEMALKVGGGAIFDAIDEIKAGGVNLVREGDRFVIAKTVAPSWTQGVIELVSRPDNTFLFGATGDQHVGSKYHREDVNRDLYRRYAAAGVQAVFNTGNWIDGEASFNRYDILAHGLDAQAQLMAEIWPKHDFPTYAVWGDDHEGWYAQREGINVGSYVEGIMRSADHNWHDLGFMEAHVKLTNANTGKSVIMAVVHPGGGSSYANSYRPQKIIESFEGGEKPAVLLLGHYHKLDPGITRNVWYLQTGTTQDQTPFMRKKSLEAHVGGAMVHLEQDPDTGAITGFTPSLWRYFNRAYYVKDGLANNRWSKHAAVSQIPRGVQI